MVTCATTNGLNIHKLVEVYERDLPYHINVNTEQWKADVPSLE